MPQPICESAAYHLLKGCLDEEIVVPVGRHELGGVEVAITFPAGAAVERGPGERGDGMDYYEPQRRVHPIAVALFARHVSPARSSTQAWWEEAILESLDLSGKLEDYLPPEALAALTIVNARVPMIPISRRTAARRLGIDPETAFSFRRRRVAKG